MYAILQTKQRVVSISQRQEWRLLQMMTFQKKLYNINIPPENILLKISKAQTQV